MAAHLSDMGFDDLDALPPVSLSSLASIPRWVAWRSEDRKGKSTKVPYAPAGGLAKADDPKTWGARAAAEARAKQLLIGDRQGGIGFQLGTLQGETCVGGLDLDSCRDAASGAFQPWAEEIIRRFGSYAEISPSGGGVKVFFLYRASDTDALRSRLGDKLGKVWSRGNHCEIAVYLGRRYFALTGQSLDPETLEDDLLGTHDLFRFVPLPDLEWLINTAGPAFMGDAAKTEKRKTDTSRSGRAFGIACDVQRNRGSIEDFRKGLAKDPDLSAWAADERQVSRTWDRAKDETTQAFAFNEDGVARNFAALYANDLRYCHTAGRWFAWDGQRWRREETQLAFDWCRQTCRAMLSDDPKNREAKALSRASAAAGVERFARADRAFAVTGDTWDRDQWLLGTPDGTVDLRTGVLGNGRQDDLITKATAVGPVPLDRFEALRDCPTWMQFLAEALAGDAGAIRFFQQWCGYSLTGDTREESLLFVHGPGGSGKSTAVNTIGDLMGDYCSNVATETLSATKYDRHPEEIARLRGARMARASETEQGRAWAQQRITAMTGGDTLTARFMRQDSFEFRPEFKLTIIGNHRPAIQDVDVAIKRRFNVLPFNHRPSRPDDTLKQRLRSEWSGILSWTIEGCLDWQRHGLLRPEIVQETTRNYFETQDTFQLWIDDCCEVGKSLADRTEHLWESWWSFAHLAGEDPGSKNKVFPDRLQQRGFTPVRDTAGIRGRGFKGLKVRVSGGFDVLS